MNLIIIDINYLMSLISEMIQDRNKFPIDQLILMPCNTSTNGFLHPKVTMTLLKNVFLQFCELYISNGLFGVG